MSDTDAVKILLKRRVKKLTELVEFADKLIQKRGSNLFSDRNMKDIWNNDERTLWFKDQNSKGEGA